MLEIISMTLGPVATNAYLIADPARGEAAVVDPAWEGEHILAQAVQRGWQISQIWLTHAHFDHTGGLAALAKQLGAGLSVALHPADLPLYSVQGGAALFGMRVEPGPQPDVELADGQILRLGGLEFEVRHAPGHTPGHVLFYCAAEAVMFCGDVIFAGSIGRTDLPGGSYDQLMNSIQTQVLSLPDETRLLSGHGAATTVGIERSRNPFL